MENQAKAAAAFAKKWQGIGDEKQDSQRFWFELLQKVYGIEDPASFVRFEQRVKLSHVSFIDVMIPATHTMIEQKSLGKDLDAPIKQSDGTFLKPFEQAKRYAAALPYSERPRWIVSCNFSEFHVYDMERPNDEPERIALKDLGKEYYRLHFLVDVRDSHIQREMDLSREAGTLVGKIYSALLPCYGDAPTAKDLQDLNKLIVRLVFCFYAEDAGLFGRRNTFHDYLASFRPQHFRTGLRDLFRVLDQPIADRDKFIEPELAAFPYVNGSLFTEDVPIPPIDEPTRNLILEEGCGFDWREISPTIFGAIFEGTLNPETRRHGGMHYTSIENIHKVIDPLFFTEYKNRFQDAMQEKQPKKRTEKLRALQKELGRGKYFDPACGSGNFLTESYLSLRRLENDILRETLMGESGTGVLGLDFGGSTEEDYVHVSIQQFYGIEINDFATSVAKTAMWIAESQMFRETEDIIHKEMDFLPLHTNSNIREGNALRMDWKEVLPPSDDVKILGNPPFVGYSLQSKEQKADMLATYIDENGKPYKKAGKIDYVSGWYFKAAEYMNGTNVKTAFVSTNSITQGEQVADIWEPLYHRFGIHIDFAYRTFRWDSESTNKAHVHVVIIGFSSCENSGEKILHTDSFAKNVSNINPYLIDAPTVLIKSRKNVLCDVPEMLYGNKPTDGGFLMLTEEEKNTALKAEPFIASCIKQIYGATEYINGKMRYCLWLVDISPALMKKSKFITERVKNVQNFRLASTKKATQESAATPTLFQEIRQPKNDYIIVPRHSSQTRRYIPMGFVSKNIIVNDAVQIIPDVSMYHFGILMSNVHMAWMRAVCGRIKSDYRYSKDVVYNNFPWPTPTPEQRAEIERTAQGILDARANHPGSSLADLYDDVFMPKDLREAHRANDRATLRAYGFPIKITEPDCVAELMKRYEELAKE